MRHRPFKLHLAVLRLVIFVGIAGMAASTLLITATAAGQGPPPSITAISQQSSLSEVDRDKVREYATYWCEQASKATDEETFRDAIRKFGGPLVARPSAVFLDEYARAALPDLRKLIDGPDLHRAVNGVLLIQDLGTDKALDELTRRTSIHDEPRWQLRLRAAAGARIIADGQLARTQPQELAKAARSLKNSVRDESHPYVLQKLLLALLACDHDSLGERDSTAVRGHIVEALKFVAERLSNPQPAKIDSEQLDAILATAARLRNKLLTLPPSEQGKYGRKLMPALGQLLAIAPEHWATMQGDSNAKDSWGKFVGICQDLIPRVDPVVRGASPPIALPKTDLRTAWDKNDRDTYQTQLQRLQGILAKPPYE